MNEYEQQAQDFLAQTGTKLSVKFEGNKQGYFGKNDPYRDIYIFTLSRGKTRYTAKFGQSIHNSDFGKTTPTTYDILAGLGFYYPETLEDFCSDFGYSFNRIQSARLYKEKSDLEYSKWVKGIFEACKRESEGMDRLFSEEEREQLADIN